MDNKELSPIEMLLDEDCTDNIVLYGENNEKTEFEQIAIIPIEEKTYAILRPLNPDLGLEENEALVFSLEEQDDEDCLLLVDDKEEIDTVFNEYYALIEEQGDDENED